MNDAQPRRSFPRGALLAVGALLAFTLLAAASASLSGLGKSESMPAAAPLEFRELRFEDRADGAVVIYEADALVDVVAPGEGGFVRGVLRALARERRSAGAAETVPFRIARYGDGRLTLEDPATGRLIDLKAFGPTNQAAFARLLARAEPAP